ncbi:MAG: hypothetical protein OXU69_08645, partial [Gemmatimonadota bacterium]|nr:hypothetical protein [Gemmatimonadota bacterium]
STSQASVEIRTPCRIWVEALIWHLGSTDPITNCQGINKLPSGAKHKRLTELLKDLSPEAVGALRHVFDMAERNDWVHGVVLNPRGDFSVLTRFRVHRSPFSVENIPIDFTASPFQEFYEAYRRFEKTVDSVLGIDTKAMCNEYLRAVQQHS